MLALNFDPFPVLQTLRLRLRKLVPEDAPAVQELRSDEHAMFFIGRPRLKSLQEAQDWIDSILQSEAKQEAVFWVIALNENPSVLIGSICLWKIQKEHSRAEMGYMLHPRYWKKGIMKETLPAVIGYAFDKMKLHSIEADVHPQNTASVAVLTSAGFVQEGHIKENYFYDGKFTDTLIFSLLNK